jgi:hypothetical protein
VKILGLLCLSDLVDSEIMKHHWHTNVKSTSTETPKIDLDQLSIKNDPMIKKSNEKSDG